MTLLRHDLKGGPAEAAGIGYETRRSIVASTAAVLPLFADIIQPGAIRPFCENHGVSNSRARTRRNRGADDGQNVGRRGKSGQIGVNLAKNIFARDGGRAESRRFAAQSSLVKAISVQSSSRTISQGPCVSVGLIICSLLEFKLRSRGDQSAGGRKRRRTG
jgi:hypothetical protein